MKRKKKKGTNLKTIVIASIIGVSLTIYAIDTFFDSFTLQSPIAVSFKVQCMVCKRPISPVPDKVTNTVITPLPTQSLTPTPTPKKVQMKSEKEVIMNMKHGNALWKIYALETSRGKNDYCRNNNLGYGGFGVKSNNKIVCYETFEKAVERAEHWLIQNGLEKNLVNALCTYNLGHNRNESGVIIPHMNCKYYQDYLKI